jgi:hypothetical protein
MAHLDSLVAGYEVPLSRASALPPVKLPRSRLGLPPAHGCAAHRRDLLGEEAPVAVDIGRQVAFGNGRLCASISLSAVL